MRLLAVVAFTIGLCCLSVNAFTNPIKTRDGSDPFVVWHEGYYYLTTTTWSNIQLTRATTINGLKNGERKTIWTDSTSSRCCNMWAPEIHWMPTEGRWFIYYSAGHSANLDNQRSHVLQSSGTNIWNSSWSYARRLVIPNRDVWAIDGTILVLPSGRYFVYSSWDGDTQCLFISRMTNATTLQNTVRISCPTNSWERISGNVNEGPAAIYRGGRTWIVYSASACWSSGYSLASLELVGSDPLNASSWRKSSGPLFASANGHYGPAHNGIFLSPSGNQIWQVYHSSASSAVTCDGARRTNIQMVNFNSDGSLNFGSPRPLSENIPEPV